MPTKPTEKGQCVCSAAAAAAAAFLSLLARESKYGSGSLNLLEHDALCAYPRREREGQAATEKGQQKIVSPYQVRVTVMDAKLTTCSLPLREPAALYGA